MEDLSFSDYKLLTGDALVLLKTLPDESVQTITTSPPYYTLRDYGTDSQIWGGDEKCAHNWGEEIPGDSRGGTGPGAKETRTDDIKSAYGRDATRGSFCQKCDAWFGELGLEPTPELFVEHLVLIFREARRVLRKDGTLFLNIADTYNSAVSNKQGTGGGVAHPKYQDSGMANMGQRKVIKAAKPKDLLGIPWLVARGLRDDGWWLRNDAIWSKAGGNCPKCHFRVEKGSGMPEPVKDRFVRAHEYVFLLSKSRKYYFDDEAVKQPFSNAKRRDVFYIPSQSFRGAHYAVMPSALANLLVSAGSSEHGACSECAAPYKRVTKKGEVDSTSQKKAGSNADGGYTGKNTKDYDEHGAQKPGDVKRRILAGMKKISTIGWAQTCKCKDVGAPVKCLVMDPFSGSGTTGAAALEHGSRYLGLELFEENNRDIAGPRLDKIVNRGAPPTVSYLPATSDIYHGDAYKLLARVIPASVRLILTDPPYNVSRKNNFQTMGRTGIDFSWDSDFDQEKWLYLADKTLKPGGSIVIWNDWKNLGLIARSLEDLGYSVKRNIIWEKKNPWPRNRDRSFVQRIETALWAVKPGAKWVFNRDKTKSFEDGIFRYGVPRAKKDRPRHEAKKPDNMFIELIEILSNEGEIVLDPFCGGGTTAYAAEKSGRIHISFESDKAWVKEAKAHWADAKPNVSSESK